MKEEILNKIKEAVSKPMDKATNSMGASESWYDEYFMVGKCFTEGDLKEMSEESLLNLIRLAHFAGEVFY